MRRTVAAAVAVLMVTSCGGQKTTTSGRASSSAEVTAAPEGAVSEAARLYLSALASRDLARANDLRCEEEHLDGESLSHIEAATADLLAELQGLEVGSIDVTSDPIGVTAAVELERSEATLLLRLVDEEVGGWRVCGQLTAESEEVRLQLNRRRYGSLATAVSLADAVREVAISGYRPTESDVAATQQGDSERGILGRTSRRLIAGPDDPKVRIVVIEFIDVEASVLEVLSQGRDPVENAVAALDVDGDHDRGVRYLTLFKTFMQPSTVGPYWDAIWLLVGEQVILVSVGPIASIDAPSLAEDIATELLERLTPGARSS